MFSGGNLGNIDPQGQQTTFGQWCNQAGGTWQKCRADTVGNDANLRVPFCNFHTKESDSETDAPVAYVYDDQTGRNPGLLRGCRADYRASQYAPNEQYQGENVGPQARRPVHCVTGSFVGGISGMVFETEDRIGKAPPCHYAFLCPGDPGPNPFLGCATTQTVSFYFEPALGTVIARWRDESGSEIEIQSGATVLAGATITFTATPETSSGFVSGWGGHCADIGETPGAAQGGQAANCVIAATTNLSVSVVFGAACVAPQVRPVDICETPSVEVCAKFNPGRFFNAASVSCEPFIECAHSATLNSETNLCECNDFGTPDFCHPSHSDFCEALEPPEFLDPETGECEALRFGETDDDYIARDGGTLDGWCSAVGGTWRRGCRKPASTDIRAYICEFEEAITFRGQNINGCRAGHNQDVFDSAKARGDYDNHIETLCGIDFVVSNLCHYVFPECPFGVPYEIAGNPFSGCGGLRVSLSASAGGTVSVESGGEVLTEGIFGSGQTLTFTATPESGFHYVSGWGGACAGVGATLSAAEAGRTAECVLAPAASATVGAFFTRGAAVAVSASDNGGFRLEGGGGVLGVFGADGGTVLAAPGTAGTLFALPDSGFYVWEWTGACAGSEAGGPGARGSAGELPCAFLAGTDLTLGAVFARGFAVEWEGAPANGTLWARLSDGSALAPGGGAASGATVIFTALPDSEHYVSGWTAGRFGGCEVDFENANLGTGARECAVAMSEDLFAGSNAPLPVFTALPRSTVYFSWTGGGTLRAETEGESLSAGDSVLHLASVSFFAEAGTGWAVSLWSGGCAGTSGTLCATVAAFGAEVRAGVAFGDVDECAAANVCGGDSVCGNLEGGFECACVGGFVSPSGSGMDCVACETPAGLNSETGECECARPNVGTAGNCRRPGADACAGLTPAEFYDSNLEECVAVAECEFPKALDVAANACVCANAGAGEDCACSEETHYSLPGDYCVARAEADENFEGVSREFLCLAFGGEVKEEGDGKVCVKLDKSGTFCILDSAGDDPAFPCRGLFKHLRRCNGEYHRPALNPFICDKECESGRARGWDCE